MFAYELTIDDDGGGSQTFAASDETMTPPFRELVIWLRSRK